MRITIPILILTSVLASGCAANQQAQIEQALSLPVSHFKATMKIDDDQMETVATFTTVNGFQEKHGLLGIVWSDSFLRGYIDKRTGVKRYQVYVVLRHELGNWQWPYQANYGRPLRTTDADRIHSDVDCSASGPYGSCLYVEHAVFDVVEEELRRVQNNATPEDYQTKVWRFKLKNKSGQDYDDALLLAEIVALLEVMDEYNPVAIQ